MLKVKGVKCDIALLRGKIFYGWWCILPKGYRRLRDYGFLHGYAKKQLAREQLVLRGVVVVSTPRPGETIPLPVCGHTSVTGIRPDAVELEIEQSLCEDAVELRAILVPEALLLDTTGIAVGTGVHHELC